MTLITADFVLTCNETFELIEHGGMVFEETILDVGTADELREKYPHATIIQTPTNSVLLPGLINSHVHLEFSANQTMLHYGDFIAWLQSVIKHRDELSALATTELISEKLDAMLRSGTTSIGAISSFGYDLEACTKAAQRVVYFNEVLGSVPSAADAMFNDFLSRFDTSKEFKSSTFIPAISVHSPYSTHPILAKKALQVAQYEQCIVSTHFMESQAERQWLDEGKGDFQTFFNAFNPHAKPLCEAHEYLELFQNTPTLFTHGVQARKDEFNAIATQKATLTHCPVSNRLLGVGALSLEAISQQDINLTLGTDGLSSNISLSLWDEMRSALMMHAASPLSDLANMLLHSVTCNAAKALQLSCGSLKEGLFADFIVATLPQTCEAKEVALQLILHTHQTHTTYINGEKQC